jgi:hypothetical protein
LSRCQRSSFSVSIEKPMRTAPLFGAVDVDDVVAVDEVDSGFWTQAAARTRAPTSVFFMPDF